MGVPVSPAVNYRAPLHSQAHIKTYASPDDFRCVGVTTYADTANISCLFSWSTLRAMSVPYSCYCTVLVYREG
jgi:hypothetical protein